MSTEQHYMDYLQTYNNYTLTTDSITEKLEFVLTNGLQKAGLPLSIEPNFSSFFEQLQIDVSVPEWTITDIELLTSISAVLSKEFPNYLFEVSTLVRNYGDTLKARIAVDFGQDLIERLAS